MARTTITGLQRFARFASPPNQRGYCGPAEHQTLLRYARTGIVDEALGELALLFQGPLPYLRTLAAQTGAQDPFAEEVVEAYWIGNELLERVDEERFTAEIEATFRGQPTVDWDKVSAALPHGVAHHSFHVLVTYPWLGLLDRPGGHALRILDQCRIRWGRVISAGEGTIAVRSRPLTYDDGQLGLGPERDEVGLASIADADRRLTPGRWVALHWEWVCEPLDEVRVQALESVTVAQLEMVNRVLLGG